MSVDDLRKFQKKREDLYLEIKGILKGVQMQKLSPTDKAFFTLIELILKGFKISGDDTYLMLEMIYAMNKRISGLEAKASELETNLLQLRETLDKYYHGR